MLTIGQIKRGGAIVYQNGLYIVLDAAHSKKGRAGAVLRTKLKNLQTNNVLEVTFQGNDKVEEADLTYRTCQFLYQDELGAYFMDQNFEQFNLDRSLVEACSPYLKEGQQIDIAFWESPASSAGKKPIAIKLPPKVDLRVTEAAPAVRGDTATSASKTIKLETGLEVLTPMFVKEGDMVRINTETGQYVERV